MAPLKNSKKRESSASNIVKSPVRTPDRSPIKKRASITQKQKQALIDNLQLEITERARKLRAQYALQAQSLRTRVELRINRIPTSLRKAQMGELLQKYVESQRRDQEPPRGNTVAKKAIMREDGRELKSKALAPPGKPKGVKRTSAEMLGADKENTPDPSLTVPMPKKRVKDTAASRAAHPSTVLSPKSSNSRTLPQSPVRPPFGSPGKGQAPSRPQSPLKSASPIKAAAAAATASLANMVNGKNAKSTAGSVAGAAGTAERKTSKQVAPSKPNAAHPKRGAAEVEKRTASGSSNVSGTSTGTTIVKRVGKALIGTAGAKQVAGAASRTTAAPKRAIPAKVKVETAKTEVPAAGRRVLRKRA